MTDYDHADPMGNHQPGGIAPIEPPTGPTTLVNTDKLGKWLDVFVGAGKWRIAPSGSRSVIAHVPSNLVEETQGRLRHIPATAFDGIVSVVALPIEPAYHALPGTLAAPAPVGHPHAALMAMYAEDAAEIAEPWERWEAREPQANFMSEVRPAWIALDAHPAWARDTEYRRVPFPLPTIRIGDVDVPKPLRKAPLMGTDVYFPCVHEAGLVWHLPYGDRRVARLLERGLLHLTREAAHTHAMALLKFSEAP